MNAIYRRAAMVTWLCAGRLVAQSTPPADPRPTIAVMGFTGGALTRSAEFATLGSGLSELVATALAAIPGVRVVERAQLQSVLDEQMLKSSDVSVETGVQVGRVLGANHFVTGGYFVGTDDRIRIDVRSINVETSLVEYQDAVEGRVGALFEFVDAIQRKLAAGLHLPPSRFAQTSTGKAPSGADQTRAISLLGRAVSALGKSDTTAAIAAARQAVAIYPSFGRARSLLAALENATSPR